MGNVWKCIRIGIYCDIIDNWLLFLVRDLNNVAMLLFLFRVFVVILYFYLNNGRWGSNIIVEKYKCEVFNSVKIGLGNNKVVY